MSFRNKNQILRLKITDIEITEMISKALRLEHANDASRVKNISAKTGINRHTISKWYCAANAPRVSHLLLLASIYPEVLKGVLRLIGRSDAWQYCLLKNVPQKMHSNVTGQVESPIYNDKYVHFDLIINQEMASKLNQRQLWFLGEVQKGEIVRARDIADIWGKTLRTARRDIEAALGYNIIEFRGARKDGRYVILG